MRRVSGLIRHERRRGGGTTHLSQIVPHGRAKAHVSLSKETGQTVHAVWQVTNIGNESADAYVSFFDSQGGLLVPGEVQTVPAGFGPIGIVMDWTIPPGFPLGLSTPFIAIYEVSSPTDLQLSTHPFTLNVVGDLPIIAPSMDDLDIEIS